MKTNQEKPASYWIAQTKSGIKNHIRSMMKGRKADDCALLTDGFGKTVSYVNAERLIEWIGQTDEREKARAGGRHAKKKGTK